MGTKKKLQGKTVPDVGETSEQKQEELVEEIEGGHDSFELLEEIEELLARQLLEESLHCPSAVGQRPPKREAAGVSILVAMCGKSQLSENLYDAGFKNLTSSDPSKDVIWHMLNRNVRARPEIKWRVMDISNFQFANETFDAIVDNGGLDILMKAGSDLGLPYLFQVKRVLKAGGKYICLTLAERLILDLLFRVFRFGWEMDIYLIGQEASSRDTKLQTFMVVAEKLGSLDVCDVSVGKCKHFSKSDSNQAREISKLIGRENHTRLDYTPGRTCGADILYSLEDLLLGAIGNLSTLVPGRRVKLSIGRPEGFAYNSVLLDAKEDSGPYIYPYAVVLVPQNRAHEWFYASEEGQWHIVVSSKASRLLMVLLDSSNSHLSMDDIQKDLSLLVKHLEPEDCGEGFEIPYLEIANNISKREMVYQIQSVLTGRIVVEDVIFKDDNGDEVDYKVRRLIFKRTEPLVQSQAPLSIKDKEQEASKHKKKGKQRKSDSQSSRGPVSCSEVQVVHNHLKCRYHKGIVFGIRLISSARGLVKTVVIGLGGGLLPMFMKNYLPSLKIEVVELDDKVLHVAREYFGFDDESLKVHIVDGIKFVKEKADENSSCKIDILVVDVYSSDTSSSLGCPAADFVDEVFLLNAKDSLSEQGLFIINLVSRCSALKNKVYSKLKEVFSCILSLQIEEDMDQVIFALKTTDSPITKDQLCEACNELAKSLEQENKWSEEDVDLLKSMKLLN